MWLEQRAPLVPMGSLVIWTMISWPSLTTSRIGVDFERRPARRWSLRRPRLARRAGSRRGCSPSVRVLPRSRPRPRVAVDRAPPPPRATAAPAAPPRAIPRGAARVRAASGRRVADGEAGEIRVVERDRRADRRRRCAEGRARAARCRDRRRAARGRRASPSPSLGDGVGPEPATRRRGPRASRGEAVGPVVRRRRLRRSLRVVDERRRDRSSAVAVAAVSRRGSSSSARRPATCGRRRLRCARRAARRRRPRRRPPRPSSSSSSTGRLRRSRPFRGSRRPPRVLAPAGEVRLEVVGPDEVLDVEERGALEADVDEGGLEPGQDPGHLAEVDVADRAAAGWAPRRSMWSSAMMPFSMRATRVSAISQEITRIFLAMLWRAFPPESSQDAACRRKQQRARGAARVDTRCAVETGIPDWRARDRTEQLLPRAPPPCTPALTGRAADGDDCSDRTSRAPTGGTDDRTFRDGAGPAYASVPPLPKSLADRSAWPGDSSWRRSGRQPRRAAGRRRGPGPPARGMGKALPHAFTLPLLPSGPGGFHASTSAGPHGPSANAPERSAPAAPRRAKLFSSAASRKSTSRCSSLPRPWDRSKKSAHCRSRASQELPEREGDHSRGARRHRRRRALVSLCVDRVACRIEHLPPSVDLAAMQEELYTRVYDADTAKSLVDVPVRPLDDADGDARRGAAPRRAPRVRRRVVGGISADGSLLDRSCRGARRTSSASSSACGSLCWRSRWR